MKAEEKTVAFMFLSSVLCRLYLHWGRGGIEKKKNWGGGGGGGWERGVGVERDKSRGTGGPNSNGG